MRCLLATIAFCLLPAVHAGEDAKAAQPALHWLSQPQGRGETLLATGPGIEPTTVVEIARLTSGVPRDPFADIGRSAPAREPLRALQTTPQDLYASPPQPWLVLGDQGETASPIASLSPREAERIGGRPRAESVKGRST